jgi:IS5 family transposase
MAVPLPKPKALLADKGYDGGRFRENLLMRGILPILPPRSNRKVPVDPDYRCYKKTVLSLESFVNLATASPWLKTFVTAA